MKPIDFVMNQPWAMLPEMIEMVVSVVDRTNDAPEAVAARLGRPLDNTRTVDVRDGVAVIPVRGVISRYSNMFSEVSGATSLQVLATDFRAALDDPDVKGVVLEIDSPGGQAAGIGEFAAQVRAGSKVKPVTSYVSNYGASAGYWIAAAGGKVVCAPTAILGSIGCVQPVPLPRKDDKGPRTLDFVSSQSPNKRPDPESDDGRAEIQRTVDALAQVFVESVAGYRKMSAEDVIEKGARGGLLVGRAAVDAGLADGLGSLESCIADIASRKPRGGRADSPFPTLAGAPAVVNTGTHMKINFGQLFTGWMKRGCPEVLDTADIEAVTSAEAPPGDPPAPVAENPPVPNATPSEDAVAAAREQFRKEMAAELRSGRVDTFKLQAEAYLSLHSARVAPAERANLASAYVAAALIDAEAPIEGYSALGGFRAGVESRQATLATEAIVAGDATVIGAHLSRNGLKVLDTASADPDAAESARLEKLLGGTEEGRALLAEMNSSK